MFDFPNNFNFGGINEKPPLVCMSQLNLKLNVNHNLQPVVIGDLNRVGYVVFKLDEHIGNQVNFLKNPPFMW